MQIDTAKAAGQLAASITAVEDILAKIDQGIAAGWDLIAFRVRDLSDQPVDLFVGEPSKATSAAAMQFARQVYEAMLADLTTQLNAL